MRSSDIDGAVEMIAAGIARLAAVDREILTRVDKLELAQQVESQFRALAVVSHGACQVFCV
jgi:hypothetical protein